MNYSSMFHLGNIIQLEKDVRSEVNLKGLEIKDSKSASLIKSIAGAKIINNFDL
jgi:hypothetical protein